MATLAFIIFVCFGIFMAVVYVKNFVIKDKDKSSDDKKAKGESDK